MKHTSPSPFDDGHDEHALKEKIRNLELAALRTDRLPEDLENLPRGAQEWFKSVRAGKPESLFLYGLNGTGKTTLAVTLAYHAIIRLGWRAVFFTSDMLLSYRNTSRSAPFKDTHEGTYKNRWEVCQNALQNADLIIIDDLGSQKPGETTEAAYSEIIGMRYQTKLSTIYTSNHWQNDGLDGKTLKDQIGARAADRVNGSRQLSIGGASKRAPKEEVFESEQVDQDVVKNFQTTGICEGETTSPLFIAHNPVFQLVSDNERKRFTDSEGRDIALPERRYRDTWHNGDDLSIVGYLLCQNDMITFLALIELLHDFHRAGGRGITFDTTVTEVRKKLGINSDSKRVTERILRSVQRIAKTRIQYAGRNREFFVGGFIDFVHYKSASKHSKLTISLNPAFIKFYMNLSFFKVNVKIPSNLSYHARLMYVFLESQSDDIVRIPVSQLAKLYGKDEAAAKTAEFRRNVRASLSELQMAGLQGTQSGLDRFGIVSTERLSRQLPCNASSV